MQRATGIINCLAKDPIKNFHDLSQQSFALGPSELSTIKSPQDNSYKLYKNLRSLMESVPLKFRSMSSRIQDQ